MADTRREGPSAKELEELHLRFLSAELHAYLNAAQAAAAHYASARLEAAEQSRALAEAGYYTLRRYLSTPAYATAIPRHQRNQVEARMLALAQTLESLSLRGREEPMGRFVDALACAITGQA